MPPQQAHVGGVTAAVGSGQCTHAVGTSGFFQAGGHTTDQETGCQRKQAY